MTYVEIDITEARSELQGLLEEYQVYTSEGWPQLAMTLEAEKDMLTKQILNNTDQTLSGKEVAWKGEVRRINWLLGRPQDVKTKIASLKEQLEAIDAAPDSEQPR